MARVLQMHAASHSTDTVRQPWDIAPDGEWEVSSELVRYASEGPEYGAMYLQSRDEQKEQMYFSSRRK